MHGGVLDPDGDSPNYPPSGSPDADGSSLVGVDGRYVWAVRTVPRVLENGALVLWAQYVGAISMELEAQVMDMGAERDGPMTWEPIAASDDELTYEFRMPYTGHVPPTLRIVRDDK